MSTQVAGVLRDPFERPLANTDIDIRAITNTFAILPGNTIRVTTNAQGEYNFILEPANYAISVILGGRAVYQGAVAVTSTTPPATLPELLKQAEMQHELPLNYAEYFQQIQATVKDDADRAQSAADSIGNELEEAQQAAAESQQSAAESQQSSQQAQAAYQSTKVIADKFTNLDDAVNQTQQNAQQTQADAQQTNADKAAAEAAAKRAEDAADSAETVNERNIRVPQNETINALPSASQRAGTFPVFDDQGQSSVKPLSSIASLDANGKVPLANIPAAAITEVFPVSSQSEMLALTADPGDVAIRSDNSKSYILMSSPAGTLANWKELTNDTLVQLAMGSGSSKVGHLAPFTNAITTSVSSLLNQVVSVKMWGAKGDGSSDDTAAIQSAIDFATARTVAGNNTSVFAPSGVYRVSKIIIRAKTIFYGEGRSTVFKKIDGSNGPVIYGVNSDSLWGYAGVDASEFAYNFDIHDFVVDGNVDGVRNKFISSATGDGIAIWGSRYRMYNIDILNCAERGIRTDYKDQNLDYLAPWFESTIYSIRINNCGKEGWLCAGPHDAAIHDVGIINGSRLGNGLYDGFWATSTMSGNIGNLHVSNGEDLMGTGYQIRHRYAGNIEGPCRFYGGTTFEGSIICCRINASGVQFDDSCTFYIPWGDNSNAYVMTIAPGCAFNTIRGRLSGNGGFRSGNTWGIRFEPGSSKISNNSIDVMMDGINLPVSFGSSTSSPDADGGKNFIKIQAYYGGSQSAIGTYGIPNTAGGTEIDFSMSGTQTIRSRSIQQTKIAKISANSSFSWNFKYAFTSNPSISFSVVGPTNTPSGGGIWFPNVSSTSCTVFNGTGTDITINITASMVVQE